MRMRIKENIGRENVPIHAVYSSTREHCDGVVCFINFSSTYVDCPKVSILGSNHKGQ